MNALINLICTKIMMSSEERGFANMDVSKQTSQTSLNQYSLQGEKSVEDIKQETRNFLANLDEQIAQHNKSKRNFHDKSKEKLVKSLAESIIHPCVFKKVRPKWLRNPETNRNLELDMYCDELKLALEYNSKIHYEFAPHIHGTMQKFEKMQQRDKRKILLCKQAGVRLIVVPYWIPEDQLQKWLQQSICKIFSRH